MFLAFFEMDVREVDENACSRMFMHRMVLIELTELIRGHHFRFLKFEVNLPADFTLDFAINLQKGL